MNNILAPIKESIAALVDTIRNASAALYAEANMRKERLSAAIADMDEAKEQMKEFTGIVDMFADVVEICGDMECASDYVDEMLSDMNVFAANIEDFNGYCDKCGAEITVHDDAQLTDDDEVICEKCFEAEKSE